MKWSIEEDFLIKECYPVESWDNLLKIFPNRNKETIRRRAIYLKIKRACHGLNQSVIERFWRKVNKKSGIFGESNSYPTECWVWTAGLNNNGYSQFWDNVKKQMIVGHRFIYEYINGLVTNDLDLDHLCRVRHCVNPDHLEKVTHKENVLRGKGFTAINARKIFCINGHEFTNENTYLGKSNPGRNCRQCIRDKRGQKKWPKSCPSGHINWKFNKRGHRLCKTCEQNRNKHYSKMRKAVHE